MKFYKLFNGHSFDSMMHEAPMSPLEELNNWLIKNRRKFLSGDSYRIVKYFPQDKATDYKYSIFIEYYIKPKYIGTIV